ncbi:MULTISPECIES: undecaprenyl-diphosphatase [Thermoactinomyces]|uniref:Undecaprenyl-diphosphatase n=1 Tax=Thermoactinomyces daqus TaxID=1329516 RepID=A0A7W1XCR4_9BACL|nr:undecaprenyl-diphosphatase [Thermoactinomyces daqus]MBA4544255.1 undecaprenyl-diphosphatase [Thermoactinomyces daqus]MBH8597993.1 undecaprenyl-diphosphatase [Thermoactinomyces sp. CICC 10523]MBH8604347.1 undecaprenyl-diphosphatase [Thermoactinomyces sp. CICC 10522]MBH8607801.1 undecaprenyl-diphosphatase [Thermoactinomyces sp. CICC 10521]
MAWDFQLFKAINGLAGQNALLDYLFMGLTEFGPYLYVLILVILLLRSSTRMTAINGFATVAVAMGLNFVIGLIYNRQRPFVAHPHDVHLLLQHDPNASFPSDHTTGAISIAVALWGYNRKLGISLFILGILIGFSRIWVGHHYPTDVLSGIVVGTLVALFIRWLDHKLFGPIPVKRKKTA